MDRWPELNDQAIADLCKVTQQFVTKQRHVKENSVYNGCKLNSETPPSDYSVPSCAELNSEETAPVTDDNMQSKPETRPGMKLGKDGVVSFTLSETQIGIGSLEPF